MDSLVVENLGKCYYLSRAGENKQSSTFRDRLKLGTADDEKSNVREFWALRNVSFRLQPGTILGVIGANGAGKTTLLKVLARVITPTTGRVVGVGRVVSLLELGAGFDPELPADENILMNAAMLGIPKHEALRRMPDIFAFAGVERFEGTPLKHYSSGMYLRLAFSVAINMNPQILLADEILAVGDQVFQERCLQRVEEGGREGLTVLFVSHDMDAIMRVCNSVMWINAGEIVRIGEPEHIVDEYQNAIWAHADASRSERGRRANRFAEIFSVRLVSSGGRDIGGAPTSEEVYVKVRLNTLKPRLLLKCALDLTTRGQLLFRSSDAETHQLADPGMYEMLAKIPANLLAESTYSVTISCIIIKKDEPTEYPLVVYNALTFMAYSTEDRVSPAGQLQKSGLIAPRLEWTVRTEEPHAARA
jgi:ABC-type polysaccharide/polyol phosphate transport system ATPase subunit